MFVRISSRDKDEELHLKMHSSHGVPRCDGAHQTMLHELVSYREYYQNGIVEGYKAPTFIHTLPVAIKYRYHFYT